MCSIDVLAKIGLEAERVVANGTSVDAIGKDVLGRRSQIRVARHQIFGNVVIGHDQSVEVGACASGSLEMPDKLSFAVELLQALEADVSWEAVILLSHVAHEELVAGELFVAALALHVLRLLQEVEVAQDELELGGRQQVAVEFRLRVVDVES